MQLNEKEYIKNLYENDILIDSLPKVTMDLLAIYLYDEIGMNAEKMIPELQHFIADRYPDYSKNKTFWDNYAIKAAKTQEKNAQGEKRKTLLQTAGIPITKTEIETIESINDKMKIEPHMIKAYQRLLFTILVVGKYQNLKNPDNDYYTNIKDNWLFELARVTATETNRDYMLYDLKTMGFVSFPENKTRVNVRPTFVDDESEVMLVVTNLNEIGWQWAKEHGEFFYKCECCGRLLSPRVKVNKKYCADCEQAKKYEYYRCEDCHTLIRRLKTTSTRKRCVSCQKRVNQTKKNEYKKRTKNIKEKNAVI